MKAGWELKTFEQIADIKGGKRLPKGYTLQAEPTPFPYLTVGDFSDNGTINPSNVRFVSAEAQKEIKKYVIRSGDIYVSIAGTIGRTGMVPSIFDGAQLTENACRLILKSDVDARFIYYFTLSSSFREQALEQTRTAAQPKLALSRLSQIRLGVPPFKEQRRIVAVLDKAFAGIATATANAQKNLTNAHALFDKYLHTEFLLPNDTNERRKVGDLIKLQRGFDITKSQQSHGNYPVVSSGGIKSFHCEAMARGPGVVIGRKGTLGKVFFVETDYWPHDTTLWVKDFKANYPKLVYYMLQCLDVKALDTGAANPALNRNLVHELEIFFPELGSQATCADRMDRIWNSTQRLAHNFATKLAALTELKQSLLKKAFAGELT